MKQLSGRAFLILTICLTLAVLLAAAALNFLVDPLMHFHAPWFGMKPVLTNAQYQNAGAIRNLEYDNLILGNSMCENFRASWFSECFEGVTLKLPMSGYVAVNLEQELAQLPRHPKNILMNMDYLILSMAPEQANYVLPDYLYDNNPVNDIRYLLNAEILAEHTIPTLLNNLTGNTTDLDTVFEWTDEIKYTRENLIEELHSTDPEQEILYTPGEAIVQVHSNLGRIEPYITAMPDTQFVFFVPPWSMMYWYIRELCGDLESVHAAYIEGLSILTSYDNVTVYFWDDPEIRALTADLDNYHDIFHYNKDISRLIAQRISNGEGILTHDACREAIDVFFQYLSEYPYDTCLF